MDKVQLLPVEKLQNIESNADDEGCKRDDVAGINKKEKSYEKQELIEVNPQPSICITNATKNVSRGKESLANDKRQDNAKTVPQEGDTEELLGSVTTYNCHGTRTSARVIQKMRQDQQTRPITPPPSERDSGRKEERANAQKTPSQVRANRPTWSNIERNHFFDALNEFGKDFEAIGNFINTKLKRRSPATDISFKSKDQVRQHYYQTYHKICKYIRFSEEVRKPVQELYALINYGEMRRKLQFVTDKHFMKLRNLIYHGHITVRCKGKNIRIKTPSCKALRRLNQLDDTLEDIRLPSKIEVIISPANMEAFGRVQTIAQNPRCRTTVPLHKKLVNFIKTFEHKWRSMDVRIVEEAKLITTQETCATPQSSAATHLNDFQVHDSEMCFLPKPGVTIHRPLLSITEYLSSVNICLTAYEERMGVKVKGANLNADRCNPTSLNTNSTSQVNNNISTTNKRLRTESGSDKRSPEQMKRIKQLDSSYENLLEENQLSSNENDSFNNAKNESSGDELSDEIQELLSDSNDINTSKEFITDNPPPSLPPPPPPAPLLSSNNSEITQYNSSTIRTKRSIGNKTSRSVFKPLLNDDVIQRIRSGWTSSTAGDITIGDLYVVFGHDSKLQLDYYWMPDNKNTQQLTNTAESQTILPHDTSAVAATNLKQNHINTTGKQLQSSNNDCYENNLQNSLQTSRLSSKLKQLLLIANLSERMRRRPCTCDRNNAAKVKYERDLCGRTFVANKSFNNCGVNSNNTTSDNPSHNVFRQPMIPVRRTSIDPVKQLTTLTRQKMSRQVLVQRLLLPSNGSANNAGQQNMNNNNSNATQQSLSNHNSSSTLLLPTTTSSATSSLSSSSCSTASTPLTATVTNSKEVPSWNQANKYQPQTTTDITNTTNNISNQSPQHNSSNTTFLNSLKLNNNEEMPQTSAAQYDHHHEQQLQQFHNVTDQSEDKIDGSITNVPSVDSAFDESSNASFLNGLSPMHLLRETSSNSKWLDDNINDFSLTSLLGHLDEINSSRDMLDASSNLSVISESSVDYMHKFQEIKALLQSQEKD